MSSLAMTPRAVEESVSDRLTTFSLASASLVSAHSPCVHMR
jgi:hypothetical protein